MRCLINIVILFLAFATLVGCKSSEEAVAEKADQPLTKKEAQKRGLYIEAMQQKVIDNKAQAIQLFKKILERDPEHAATHFQLSKIYDEASSIIKAKESAKKAYEIDDQNIWYAKQLASLYRKTGDYEKSLELYEILAEREPANLEYQTSIAEISFITEDIDRAIEALDIVIDIVGPQTKLLARKIQMYIENEDIKEAEKLIEKYISEDPNNVDLYQIKANLYRQTDQTEKIIEIYQKIAEIDPGNAKAQFIMAEQYAKKGNNKAMMDALLNVYSNPNVNIDRKVKLLLAFYKESASNNIKKENAYKLLDTLVKVHPEEAKTYSIYGDFLMRDDRLKEAKTKFEKAADLDPSRYPIWNQLLMLDIELSSNDDMIRHGEKAAELFPSQPLVYLISGIGHVRKKNYNKAIDFLTTGENLVIDNEQLRYEFYVNLGESYYAIEKKEKAFENYQKAVEINSSNPYLLNNYAYYLSLEKKQLDSAKKYVAKANKLEPGQSSFQDTYAYILFLEKDYDEAWKWIQKALENGGHHSGTILEHAGDIAIKRNNKKEALSYWKKAQGKEGVSEQIKEKIAKGKYVETQ